VKLREAGRIAQTIEKFDASVEQATTSSLEALKAYSMDYNCKGGWGRINESIPFHKRAVERISLPLTSFGRSVFSYAQRDRAAESFTGHLNERVSQREKFQYHRNYYRHVAWM